MPRLFVYGSLKSGLSNAPELAGARLLGERRTAGGFRLVVYQEGFPALARARAPGALESPRVAGELYEVERAHLEALDRFEECPELYQRELIELETGELAYAYVISEAEAARWECWDAESWHEGARPR